MKITPTGYGLLYIKAENDAEALWLGQFLEGCRGDIKDSICGRSIDDNKKDLFPEDLNGDELIDEITISNSGL